MQVSLTRINVVLDAGELELLDWAMVQVVNSREVLTDPHRVNNHNFKDVSRVWDKIRSYYCTTVTREIETPFDD